MPVVAQPHFEGGGELSGVTGVELKVRWIYGACFCPRCCIYGICHHPAVGSGVPKEKKNTWKPDAIKLLICTSVTLTNAVTTTGHEMDQRRCYSFRFFFLFFKLPLLLCKLC